jgi:copper chaperone NosL
MMAGLIDPIVRYTRPLAFGLLALTVGCASGPPPPASLAPGQDTCRFCRMLVSNTSVAAQIVAPSEEPVFFDDIGCLRNHLNAAVPGTIAYAYVADHRTGQWVAASQALYTRASNLATPMSSHLIAHADAAGRDLDPAAAAGTPLTAADVFGPTGVAGHK